MSRDWAARTLDAIRAVDWRRRVADVLVGPRTRRQAARSVAVPAAFLAVSTVGYATGAFAIQAKGLLFFPIHAALVGAVAAFAVGYATSGFLLAALAIHGAAVGFRVANVATQYPGWTLAQRVRDLLRLDVVAYFGVLSAVIAFWPFVAGLVVRWVVASVRGFRDSSPR